jgi:CRISPR-associated endonuclease/helicase Cas3
VYDPYILGRTWALLSEETVVCLPQDIDRLVQYVYGGDSLPQHLEEKALAFIEGIAYGQHLANIAYERLQALNIGLDPGAEPDAAYAGKPRGIEEGDGPGLVNRTRLGEESLTVVPVYQVFGGWSLQPMGTPFDPHLPLSDDLARAIYARQLRISRKAIMLNLIAEPLPRSFDAHPLLRHMRPCVLDSEGFAVNSILKLRLDDALGLVYEQQHKDEGIGA